MSLLLVHQLFEKQVLTRPDAIAVKYGSQSLTYAALNQKANQLAHALIQKYSLQPDELIPLIMDRGLTMLVTILAVLKAGAAYIPVSMSWPEARIKYILNDCMAKQVLTQKHLLSQLAFISDEITDSLLAVDALCDSPSWSGENPKAPVHSSHLVYAIYTSGSTGQPKGVLIEHGSLVNLLTAINEHLEAGPQDHFLALTEYTFDISVLELLLPLIQGACCVIAETGDAQNPEKVITLFNQYPITITQATPALWQLLLEQGCQLPPQLKVLCGGEALTKSVAQLLLKQIPRFWNVYGPTETTIWTTIAPITREMSLEVIPIGKPLSKTQAWIVDEALQRVPPHQSGELLIGGAGLARGYINNPKLTAEKFIQLRFADGSVHRAYRTGDKVGELDNGDFEFIARVDDQIKINGFRIEPGEIEHHLLAIAGIGRAVVLLIEHHGMKQLCAAILLAENEEISLAEIHGYLVEKLPDYMIPNHFFKLSTLPLSPHGKVDKKQLRIDLNKEIRFTARYMPPNSPMEKWLCSVWNQVLQLKNYAMGIEDNFFLSGGHSLHAAQVIARIRQNFSIELTVRDLFNHPMISQFAGFIEKAIEGQTNKIPLLTLKKAKVTKQYPLSFAQEGLWFVHQLSAESALFNLPVLLRIKGYVDIQALDRAWSCLRQRHAILRTHFVRHGMDLVQCILPVEETASLLQIITLEHQTKKEVMTYVSEELKQPFSLDEGPLVRAILYCLGDKSYLLQICIHHLICDEWSLQIISRELAHFYEYPDISSLPALPFAYADFCVWQRQNYISDHSLPHLDYWRHQLADLPVLELPLDYHRPLKQVYSGAHWIVEMPAPLMSKLDDQCQQWSISLYTYLFTAFGLLCSRYSNQDDFAIGAPVAGRNLPELEPIIGLLINTLVLRVDFSGNANSLSLLKRHQEVIFDGFEHQDVPFEKVVELVNSPRDPARSPLFQVMLVMQNVPQEPWRLAGTSIHSLTMDSGSSQYDLTLLMVKKQTGWQCQFIYNTQLFKQGTIKSLGRHFLNILRQMSAYPEKPVLQLMMLDGEESRQLITQGYRAEKFPHQHLTLSEIFEQQVLINPQHIALSYEERHLTYDELNRKANQLAHYLREHHQIAANQRIIILLERSVNLIIAILAVLKAGGAYVPLDERTPLQRILEIVQDCGARLVLSQTFILEKNELQNQCSDKAVKCINMDTLDCPKLDTNLSPIQQSDDLAYVIYTSGSTGKPKGVMIHHGAIVNTVQAQIRAFKIDSQSRILQFASCGFDSSVGEIFRALLAGARLVMSHPDDLIPGEKLATTIIKQGITVLTQPPAALALLPVDANLPLKTLITAGESCPPGLMRLWAGRLLFINAYGPTETSICATLAVANPDDLFFPIGKPLANVAAYVLDKAGQPVPVNVWGELHIGGLGVGKGYLNRPDLTEKVFIHDSFAVESDRKMYKSGDRVRWLANGNLEYAGRLDDQLKIRGFRIEPVEIAAKIKAFPGVEDVAIVAQTLEDEKRLVAFIVANKMGGSEWIGELRQFLNQRLPHYMIPDRFMLLDKIPLTINRKTDHALLLQKQANSPWVKPLSKPPECPIEQSLVLLFEKLLKIKGVGTNDNFFELGGHSLLIIHLAMAIETEFKQKISINQLISQPTVATIASLIREPAERSIVDPVLVLNSQGNNTPIFLIHETSGLVTNYKLLAQHFGNTHPIYAIQDPVTEQEQAFMSIQEMATFYIKALKKKQSKGPYIIGGWCMGGIIAFEMAQQLFKEQGDNISLILIDTPADVSLNQFKKTKEQEFEQVRLSFIERQPGDSSVNEHFVLRRTEEIMHRINLMRQYKAQNYPGKVLLIHASEATRDSPLVNISEWQALAENLAIHPMRGTHYSLLKEPEVAELAAVIVQWSTSFP